MKKAISGFMILTLAFSFLSLLSGCGGDNNPKEPESVALVMCNRSNFTYLSLQEDSDAYKANADVCGTIFRRLSDAFFSYGKVYAISTDCYPSVISVKAAEPSGALIDTSKRRQNANNDTYDFVDQLEANAAATHEESDLLQAISLAGNALSDVSGKKRIIICDSGLSTSGYVNFQSSNLFEEQPERVVENLKEKHALPSLAGIETEWYGMNSVSGEQSPLPAERKYNLRTLWESILKESGADVTIKEAPLADVSSDVQNQLPHVTAIPMPDQGIDNGGYVEFLIDDIRFNPDSAEIVSVSPRAGSQLSDLVEKLNYSSYNIVIAGSTASFGGDGKALSMARADAVKDLLVKRGANSSRISCVAIGRTPVYPRVNDLNPDGSLNESMATKNRAVFIYKRDCELARMISKTLQSETI